MIQAIFKYTFLQNAVLAAVFVSIISGIIGTIVVEKKLVSMSGGIAHTSFGGIGLGYLLGVQPIITGMLFAIFASMSLPVIKRKTGAASDTLIGVFWATGMALGILFIGLTPGYPPDMTSYLFGDILTVSSFYLTLMMILSVIVIVVVSSMYHFWKAYLFDEAYLQVIGVTTKWFERLLYIILAISIVLLIKVVGIILAIALLTLPPSIAKLYTKRLSRVMISGTLISIGISILGLALSYYFNIPSGATIILLAVLTYLLSYFFKKIIVK